MAATVEVTIGADAAVTVEAKGVVGSGCKALTAAIENAIGSTTGDALKPDFHRHESAKQQGGQCQQQ